MSSSAQPLVVRCRHCGGSVSVTLAGPPTGCRHCGREDALDDHAAGLVAQLRARLEQRSGSSQRLTGKLVSAVTSVQGMAIALGLTMWGLFGGMALGLALEHEVPLMDFLRGDTRDGELSMEWWLLFSLALGFPLSLFSFGLSLHRLRSLGRSALPLPPVAPGAPPRCRACAAELPKGTALRRCQYCRCDNLIVGEHYRRVERSLDQALARIADEFGRDLALRTQRAESRLFRGAMAPVVLLLVVPIAGLFVEADTRAWPLVALAWVMALSVLGLAFTRRLPTVHPLACLVLGSRVEVDGEPLRVKAQLVLDSDQDGTRVLSLLGPEHTAPTLAFHGDYARPRWVETLWSLEAGGAPLEQQASAGLQPAQLRVESVDAEGVSVESVAVLDDDSLRRVWPHGADVGAPPLWTLRPRDGSQIMDADDCD